MNTTHKVNHNDDNKTLPDDVSMTGGRKCDVTSVRTSEDPGQFQGRITKGADATHGVVGRVPFGDVVWDLQDRGVRSP